MPNIVMIASYFSWPRVHLQPGDDVRSHSYSYDIAPSVPVSDFQSHDAPIVPPPISNIIHYPISNIIHYHAFFLQSVATNESIQWFERYKSYLDKGGKSSRGPVATLEHENYQTSYSFWIFKKRSDAETFRTLFAVARNEFFVILALEKGRVAI